MLTLADVMTPYPITAEWTATLQDCAHLLVDHRIRSLPLVSPTGRLRGMLCDFMLFRRGHLGGDRETVWEPYDAADTARIAREIAVPADVVGLPEEPLVDLIDRLLESRQCAAVVTDATGRVIGILTEQDAVRIAAKLLPPEEKVLNHASNPVRGLERTRPASEALDLMRTEGTRHVVVLSDGLLYGVVSYRDLVDARVLAGADRRVDAAIVGTNVYHAAKDTSLRAAVRLMAEAKVGCVPMVDEGGRPIATLTRVDVLRSLRDTLAKHPGLSLADLRRGAGRAIEQSLR